MSRPVTSRILAGGMALIYAASRCRDRDRGDRTDRSCVGVQCPAYDRHRDDLENCRARLPGHASVPDRQRREAQVRLEVAVKSTI